MVSASMQEVKITASGEPNGMRLIGTVVRNERKVSLDLPFTGSEGIASTLRSVADYLEENYQEVRP